MVKQINRSRSQAHYENVEVQDLWSDWDEGDNFTNETFQILVMEQYKLYVELTDRAAFRRIIVNLFFLMLNILVISLLALGISRTSVPISTIFMLFPFFGLLSICYIWRRLVSYYRHTVMIKERVIGELEKKLPSSPIWLAERNVAVEKGTSSPLNRLESYMPYVFAGLYCTVYISLFF